MAEICLTVPRTASCRLVLEAWERFQPPQGGSSLSSEAKEDKPENPAGLESLAHTPPPPSDYGLYRCSLRSKRMVGFDKENHLRDAHGGQRAGFV